jgi:hypothetical protein
VAREVVPVCVRVVGRDVIDEMIEMIEGGREGGREGG